MKVLRRLKGSCSVLPLQKGLLKMQQPHMEIFLHFVSRFCIQMCTLDDIYELYQTCLMSLLKFYVVCVVFVIYLSQYRIVRQFLATCIHSTASTFTIRSNLAFTSFSMLIGLNHLVHIFLVTSWVNTDVHFRSLTRNSVH